MSNQSDKKQKLSADTDAVLVKKVQAGNKQAFDMLVIKYQHKVVNLISRYMSDSSEVYDVAQESFIKAYRALKNFRGDSAFYTWLYRIAINTAKNHLVARGRRPQESGVDIDDAQYFENETVLRDIATPEEEMAKDQLESVLVQAIDDLPSDLRTAVTLREFDGLSYEDIAEIMQCPVGTVRSRIFRAREAIEGKIKPILNP